MKILHVGMNTGVNGFSKALIKACDEYSEINCGDSNVNNLTNQLNKQFLPDIIFFQYQQADVIVNSVFNQLKDDNPNAWIVNYTGDVRYPLPQHYINTGKLIDCTLFSNYTDVHEARRLGIKADYLQYGIDPEIYFPNEDNGGVPEIVFMGNNYTNQFPLSIQRKQMVDRLKQEYGTNFGVYGTNWGHHETGNLMHSQTMEADVYRRCKIAINFSHFDYERYSSDRMFRLMASGAFCLTHRYAGIHLDFTSGENVATFDTFDHLKFQIDYYLSNDLQRKEIAEKGCKLAHEKFTFDAMINNLLKLYNERL